MNTNAVNAPITHDAKLAATLRKRYAVGEQFNDKEILSAYARWRNDGENEQAFLLYLTLKD